MGLTTIQAIYHAFDGKLVGKPVLKTRVCEAVLKLPEDVQKLVTKRCWFVGSLDDAWGYTIKGAEIKDDFLIILNDELWEQPAEQAYFTVLHELGHVQLGHRNSIGELQGQSEITRQEMEADQFAQTYLQ